MSYKYKKDTKREVSWRKSSEKETEISEMKKDDGDVGHNFKVWNGRARVSRTERIMVERRQR